MGGKNEFGEKIKWTLPGPTFRDHPATDPQVKYAGIAWLASIQTFWYKCI